MKKRAGYMLFSIIGIFSLIATLLTIVLLNLGNSQNVADNYIRRTNARSKLLSLTNLSWCWLASEMRAGVRPRALAVLAKNELTGYDSLRIFLSDDLQGGMVGVYDLDYEPAYWSGGFGPSSLIPSACPFGYLIRASVKENGMSPITTEVIFVLSPDVLSSGDVVHVLNDKPLLWRELWR